jgi:hypothetical protein
MNKEILEKVKIVFPTKVKIPLVFPTTEKNPGLLHLIKVCGSVDMLEKCFGIEFSCGDGKYYLDFAKPVRFIEKDGKVIDAVFDEESIDKYDGKIDYSYVPRFYGFGARGERLKAGKSYTFEVISDEKSADFYLNNTPVCIDIPVEYLV